MSVKLLFTPPLFPVLSWQGRMGLLIKAHVNYELRGHYEYFIGVWFLIKHNWMITGKGRSVSTMIIIPHFLIRNSINFLSPVIRRGGGISMTLFTRRLIFSPAVQLSSIVKGVKMAPYAQGTTVTDPFYVFLTFSMGAAMV